MLFVFPFITNHLASPFSSSKFPIYILFVDHYPEIPKLCKTMAKMPFSPYFLIWALQNAHQLPFKKKKKRKTIGTLYIHCINLAKAAGKCNICTCQTAEQNYFVMSCKKYSFKILFFDVVFVVFNANSQFCLRFFSLSYECIDLIVFAVGCAVLGAVSAPWVLIWCKRIVTLWFVLRGPYGVNGIKNPN